MLGAAVTLFSLAVTACGGGDSDSTGPGARTAAKESSSAAAADPLSGEWQTEFTCKQSARVVHARLSDRELRCLGWEAAPCRNQASTVLLARFDKGALALCEPDSGLCEVNATYALVDEDTIRVDDPAGYLCNRTGPTLRCPVTWNFERIGDRLTFQVSPDPWVMSAWEAAPFELVS